MHTIPSGLYKFKVTDPPPACGRWREHMPRERAAHPYYLYKRARNFWRSKVEFEFTRSELISIFTDVRLASDQGDWGAKALLSHFYFEGLGPLDTNVVQKSEPEKALILIREAIDAGQAWGYYDLGVAYEHGYGGLVQDSTIAWAYYRRAAELGSPEAQMALADAYEDYKQRDIAKDLRLCAYHQGHGEAAEVLGRIAQLNSNFTEALEYHQNGVRFGNMSSAVSLRQIFYAKYRDQFTPTQLENLGSLKIRPDEERGKRYDLIADALDLNPDLRFPNLDNVLPLPPADLPAWRGVQGATAPDDDTLPAY